MSRLQRVTNIVLRVLLCALFLFSAFAKLADIDRFELYLFSYGVLPLNLCFMAARLCIGIELVCAWLIAAGRHPRTARLLTVGLLLLFSLFLCYAMLVGRSDSCQCFGSAVELKPAPSLLKNALLLLLVLLCFRTQAASRPPRRRWVRNAVGVGVSAVLLAVPFVVSVPDNWMFGPSSEPYNAALLDEAIAEGGALEGMVPTSGGRLVAFVTPGCPYCAMARQKLDAIALRHHLSEGSIAYVEPADIGNEAFLHLTYGARPLVLLFSEGRVVGTYHYRNISEREVVDVLASR